MSKFEWLSARSDTNDGDWETGSAKWSHTAVTTALWLLMGIEPNGCHPGHSGGTSVHPNRPVSQGNSSIRIMMRFVTKDFNVVNVGNYNEQLVVTILTPRRIWQTKTIIFITVCSDIQLYIPHVHNKLSCPNINYVRSLIHQTLVVITVEKWKCLLFCHLCASSICTMKDFMEVGSKFGSCF